VPPPAGKAWRAAPDALELAVRVTPKGGRDAIEGVMALADGTCLLKVRLRAPPSGGAANAALIRLLAQALGVPQRAVSLFAGAGARIKRLKIEGPGAILAARLDAICAARPVP
jgi:uncharacterized protein YggU (UPF0235/DUF167 family)